MCVKVCQEMLETEQNYIKALELVIKVSYCFNLSLILIALKFL